MLGFNGFPKPRKDSARGGKQTASGVATGSATTEAFQLAGATSTIALPFITVTGLSFKPSLIYVVRFDGTESRISIYEEVAGQIYPKTMKLAASFSGGSNTSASTYHLKGDVATASVANGSFTIPVYLATASYTWVAYE